MTVVNVNVIVIENAMSCFANDLIVFVVVVFVFVFVFVFVLSDQISLYA
jgi:hypothetical protein